MSYCGSIGLVDSPITYQQVGFGYNYSGHIDLSFNPAPPSGILISAVLNAASIGGEATTNGSTSLQIPFSGSSLACQLTNPSTWVIFDQNGPATSSGTAPVLATLTFTWQNGGGCR